MTVTSKIRIYDLAKELKLDTKRLIEEVRREGVDVSVPSNSVSKELAEKIRTKYFPKKETAVKRGIKVVKRAERAVEEPPAAEAAPAESAPAAEVTPELPLAEVAAPADPRATPATPAAPIVTEAAKQPVTSRLLRKLPPAARRNTLHPARSRRRLKQSPRPQKLTRALPSRPQPTRLSRRVALLRLQRRRVK